MVLPERYEIVGEPLDGGMGTVFHCKDKVLERSVALKIIHDTTEPRRMRDELAALLKMRSKHVVQVYDILEVARNELAIVQEFIDGRDLFDDRTAPHSTEEFYKQLWQIAVGLSDIHALGVIHRDIKPNNMKMDAEGIIKIFDFGLARDEGHSASTLGFVGTRGFAAPELYDNEVSFTAAVDTYAFGVTALYLATRSLPDSLKNNHLKPYGAIHIDDKYSPGFVQRSSKTYIKCDGKNYFSDVPFNMHHEVKDILESCINCPPTCRPKISAVRDILAKHLLFNRHRALVVYKGQPSYLDANNRSVSLTLNSMGHVEIQYDGLDFRAANVLGDVYVNNMQFNSGDILPGSCVVALGTPAQGNLRKYITFDLAHPEIVL
ncbi:MAG TPA: protein kinase [Methylobacter sp.]|jgi:serine/threonine-protein kinase